MFLILKSLKTRLNLLVLLVVAGCSQLYSAEQLTPIPSVQELDDSRGKVMEIYSDTIASAKKPLQKSMLAKELLRVGSETVRGSPEQYALLEAALRLGVDAGDVAIAFSTIERTGSIFAIDTKNALKLTFESLSRGSLTDTNKQLLTKKCIEIALKASNDGDVPSARVFINQGTEISRRLRDSESLRTLMEMSEQLDQREKDLAEFKLAEAELLNDPTNGRANLVAGRYKCFVAGEWEEGCLYLIASDDKELREAALCELEEPKNPLRIANLWWACASKTDGKVQLIIQSHARTWYKIALPGLVGIDRKLAEKRLETAPIPIDPAQKPVALRKGQWFRIFPSSDMPNPWTIDIDSSTPINLDSDSLTITSAPRTQSVVRYPFSEADIVVRAEILQLSGENAHIELRTGPAYGYFYTGNKAGAFSIGYYNNTGPKTTAHFRTNRSEGKFIMQVAAIQNRQIVWVNNRKIGETKMPMLRQPGDIRVGVNNNGYAIFREIEVLVPTEQQALQLAFPQ